MCGIVENIEIAPSEVDSATVNLDPEPKTIATPDPDPDLFRDGLDGKRLANRLGYSQASGVTRPAKIISADEFATRTKARDPDGIAWKWNGEEGNKIRFFPVGDRA